ncbi:MAG TPA: sulfatase [Gemmatimonadaceae bacterium]|nr:sulfatase [Gemmatimonadaceae bacterium]
MDNRGRGYLTRATSFVGTALVRSRGARAWTLTTAAILTPAIGLGAWTAGGARAFSSAEASELRAGPLASPPGVQQGTPRNVVVILSDDHRFDFMGFMPGAPDWLDTPAMDRMAAGGAHVRNAFVTTSLCSPSRASILTGQYAHRHGVVDNTSPIPPGTVFFPQHLQRAGYRTAYVGKWHMGEDAGSDQPRPGFDHWVSFRGQGVYVDPLLNVNGDQVRRQGYTTDLLTDYALDWLRQLRPAPGAQGSRPFFLMLSHKAVHAEFVPAERHEGRHANEPIPYPATMAGTRSLYEGKPNWVREQRYSWHGVEYMYHGQFGFDEFYRRYTETLLALDESVGRVLDYLDEAGLSRNTLVLYLGDNGFLLGEHGLIDKRHAYEASMRIPMLAYAPGWIAPGSVVTQMVRNIDLAPTILDLAGVRPPAGMDGQSVLAALRGGAAASAQAGGGSEMLYEYYWEYAFPHTPTTLALRGDRYKYIFYHGVWDKSELYDLVSDPEERRNLIDVPAYQDTVLAMRRRLFDRLEAADAMRIPLRRGDWQAAERKLP